MGCKLNIVGPEVQPRELVLREYQKELAEPANDGKNVIVSAPTGSGKTHVALRITQVCSARPRFLNNVDLSSKHWIHWPDTNNFLPQHHFETAEPEQEPKVVFLVPTVTLVQQQWKMFKEFLNEHKSIGISGDLHLTEKVPIEQLIQRFKIIILMPQILVDALKAGTVPSLSIFSLLLYDECHHALKTHPYAEIQYHYLKCKLDTTPQQSHLPQVHIRWTSRSSSYIVRKCMLYVCCYSFWMEIIWILESMWLSLKNNTHFLTNILTKCINTIFFELAQC